MQKVIKITLISILCSYVVIAQQQKVKEQGMEEMWGNQDKMADAGASSKTSLFDDGNYAMFIHWGLYSNIANKWKDTTYYGCNTRLPILQGFSSA